MLLDDINPFNGMLNLMLNLCVCIQYFPRKNIYAKWTENYTKTLLQNDLAYKKKANDSLLIQWLLFFLTSF